MANLPAFQCDLESFSCSYRAMGETERRAWRSWQRYKRCEGFNVEFAKCVA